MEDSIHFWKRPISRLAVFGPDAATFLQGQFSNDLRRKPGSVTYGLWLNHKGRVLADGFILRRDEDRFDVVPLMSDGKAIADRLESFIIADDVTLDDATSSSEMLTIAGPSASDVLEDLGLGAPGAGEFLEQKDVCIFRGRLAGRSPCWHIVGGITAFDRIREMPLADKSLKSLPVEKAAFDRLRILDGVPEIPTDIGPEDLPQEASLENEAISFTKGCFVGQEVMARLHNLGRVRRHLFITRLNGSVEGIRTGTELRLGDRKLGEIRSFAPDGADTIALAMLPVHGIKPGDRLTTHEGLEVEIVRQAEGRAW